MDKHELKNELTFIVTKLGSAQRSLQKLTYFSDEYVSLHNVYETLSEELEELRKELKGE